MRIAVAIAFGASMLGWLARDLNDTSRIPNYYPSSYSGLIRNARSEGELVIYSNLRSLPLQNNLLGGFKKLYPFIKVTDADGDGATLTRRFAREIAGNNQSADLVLSSTMDLQEKLINDGYALPYASPETPQLEPWAHWKDLGYGITSEPVAFVYNSTFVAPLDMAHTHAGLEKVLREKAARYTNHVATYDPHRSQVGMLFLTQDIQATPDAWNLFKVLGSVKARTYSTSAEMLENLSRGEQWIAYDAIASYAAALKERHPSLTVVFPTDYTLSMSRVAFISASARHPACAKLFLDYLLSRAGQEVLGQYGMGSTRTGMNHLTTGHSARIRAIRIGPGLLAALDSLVRAQFFRRWNAIGMQPANAPEKTHD
jgi:iron(III) transport system substrate-binding protein